MLTKKGGNRRTAIVLESNQLR